MNVDRRGFLCAVCTVPFLSRFVPSYPRPVLSISKLPEPVRVIREDIGEPGPWIMHEYQPL